MISNHVTSYEKRTKKVIPRAGTEMDMGKSLIHKRLAFYNDGTHIEKLYAAGYNEWDMAFFTGLPIYVVKEYVEIIKFDRSYIEPVRKVNNVP